MLTVIVLRWLPHTYTLYTKITDYFFSLVDYFTTVKKMIEMQL